MKHFDIWVDRADNDPTPGKVLMGKEVLAPTFKDACTLIFGNHIWFDIENLTFRGARLSGETRFTSWEMAHMDSADSSRESIMH